MNAHSTLEVATVTGSGKLVPIQVNKSGRIESALPIAETVEVHFAFSDIDFGAIPFAQWISPSRHEFVVGVVSPDGNWILTPGTGSQAELGIDLSLFQKVAHIFAWVLFAVSVLFIWSALRSHSKTVRQYKEGVQSASAFSSTYAAQEALKRELSSEWRGADARTVKRVINNDLYWIVENASLLEPGVSPYRLWKKASEEYGDEEGTWGYLDIAFLAGDLVSLQKIAEEATDDYAISAIVNWQLPDVLWQTAIESLYEGNFRRARIYASLYLAEHYQAARRIDVREAVGKKIQRSVTMAHIMRREFKSGRILSLCRNLDYADAFGASLYKMPGRLPGLDERRRIFEAKFCAETEFPRLVNYNAIRTLGVLNARSLTNEPPADHEEACSIAPVECEYMRLRAAASEKPSSDAVYELLHFASKCTYLSDDAIADAIEGMMEIAAADGDASVRFESLSKAMLCVSTSSDEFLSVTTKLDEVFRCIWIDWGEWSGPTNPLLAPIEAKCRRPDERGSAK